MIEKDYTTTNLHLLKGVLRPPNSRVVKGSNWDNTQEIPMSLEEVMRRQRIALEDEIASKQAILEKERQDRMLDQEIMLKSMVPEQSSIKI